MPRPSTATSCWPLACGDRPGRSSAPGSPRRSPGWNGWPARISSAATAAAPDRPRAQPTPEALAELEQQLDALEAARDEIARLEASVGLPQVASS